MEPHRPERDDVTPNLVGRTSAELLAAGIDRRDRLAALHLLAILDASTDAGGRVRRPLDDLADEFDLEPLSVIGSLDHLERAGAITRDGGGVVLLGTSPEGLGGMHLADFLEDVRASLDGEIVSLPARRARRVARRGAVLVAAASILAVATFAPSTQPAFEQPLAASTSTTADASTTTSALAPSSTTAADAAAVASTTTAPDAGPFVPDTGVVAASTCPTSSPVAEVVDRIIRITNPTNMDVVVTEILVGAVRLTAPITVPAGATVERPLAIGATDEGEIVEWEFSDTTVERSCPS